MADVLSEQHLVLTDLKLIDPNRDLDQEYENLVAHKAVLVEKLNKAGQVPPPPPPLSSYFPNVPSEPYRPFVL